MARIFISGSSDGLGRIAAKRLVSSGHEVVLHARNRDRARDTAEAVPGARGVLVGELSSFTETRALAEQANAAGPFDAVIHNAGVGFFGPRVDAADGLPLLFVVNLLAPYVLSALMRPPRRLVYVSSQFHRDGNPDLTNFHWKRREWNGQQAYGDSKLFLAALAFAIARLWPNVLSNAIEPGWVPTKMGGPDAPDDLALGAETQVWLAVSDDPNATVTGRYFHHQIPKETHPAVSDVRVQEDLLRECERLTGVAFPRSPAASR